MAEGRVPERGLLCFEPRRIGRSLRLKGSFRVNVDWRLGRLRIANCAMTAIVFLVTTAACENPSRDALRVDKLIKQLKQVRADAEIGEAHETPHTKRQ